MNSTRAPTSQQQSVKHPLCRANNEHTMDIQGTRLRGLDKARIKGKQACREKKLDLLQDVDRLRKKLRDEENIHRALQRAFNRPLGSLPRLPPCLPLNLLELVAEIAVLEEEVVRLEEQVITYSENLYQDSILINSKKKSERPTKNSEHNFNRGTTSEKSHSEIALLSVARTSASSDILSDRSSLSLDKSSSTSSDITSDQTGKFSSDSSPGNWKSKPYQTRNTDAGSRCIGRKLMNGKTGPNSSENGKAKRTDQQTFELHLELHRKILLSERKIPRLKSQVK